MHPETAVEDMDNYIVENMPLTEKSKFKCSKLVKKDKALSTLSFVSFKIDCHSEDFDILSDPEYWPTGKPMREFIELEAPKLISCHRYYRQKMLALKKWFQRHHRLKMWI